MQLLQIRCSGSSCCSTKATACTMMAVLLRLPMCGVLPAAELRLLRVVIRSPFDSAAQQTFLSWLHNHSSQVTGARLPWPMLMLYIGAHNLSAETY